MPFKCLGIVAVEANFDLYLITRYKVIAVADLKVALRGHRHRAE